LSFAVQYFTLDIQALVQTLLQKIQTLEARVSTLEAENALLKNKKTAITATSHHRKTKTAPEKIKAYGNPHKGKQAASPGIKAPPLSAAAR
jgi:hypothetical protein